MTRMHTFNQIVEPGRYRHYKGEFYEVLGVAKHSETLEELVIYKALYKNRASALWVRPKSMFMEKISFKGQMVSRFEKVNPKGGDHDRS